MGQPTKVKHPFGPATVTDPSIATGAVAVTIDNELTVLDLATTEATGNRTVNLTIDDCVDAGARLIVKSKTAATQTTIPGTGMAGPTTTGVAGKTKVAEFIYDGTEFMQTAVAVQLD